MAYSKTCRQHFGFVWLIWLVNQSNVLHVDISPCQMSHVIHFEFSLSDEKICIIGLQNLSYFVLYSIFGSPLCLIMEKMNERSYFDVVSGSGKFIFAVSTRYLFGVCCNLCASDFTWPRAIVCLNKMTIKWRPVGRTSNYGSCFC